MGWKKCIGSHRAVEEYAAYVAWMTKAIGHGLASSTDRTKAVPLNQQPVVGKCGRKGLHGPVSTQSVHNSQKESGHDHSRWCRSVDFKNILIRSRRKISNIYFTSAILFTCSLQFPLPPLISDIFSFERLVNHFLTQYESWTNWTSTGESKKVLLLVFHRTVSR